MDGKTPTIRVQIFEGDQIREEVFTQAKIRIGTSGQNHLRLTDPTVSRQHAAIEVTPSGEVILTDLETTSGTIVQGKRVKQTTLRPGYEILVGSTRLVVDYVADASVLKVGADLPAAVSQEDLKTGKFGVDVSVQWGEYPLQHDFFPAGTTVRVGEGPKDQIFLPEEVTGTPSFAFLVPDEKFFSMNVSGENVDADFLVDDKIIRLPEMKRRGLVVNDSFVRIDHRTAARVRYGEFTFVVGLASQPRVSSGSWWKRFSMREHVYLMISLLFHLAVALLVALVPEQQITMNKDPYDRDTRALRKVQVAMMERKVDEEEKKKEEQEARKRLDEMKDQPSDGTNERLDRTQPTEKETSKLVPANADVDRAVANSAMTEVLGQQEAMIGRLLDSAGSGLGGGTMGIRVIGDTGMDADLASSLGAFGGMGGGGGGGGFQGTGAWGGGGGEFAPADLRGISGLGKKDAEGASANVRFKKGAGAPKIFAGDISIKGELDRETVRRYIQTKMDQIRYCYQQELQKNPDLKGQISMQWVILPNGNTASVRVAGNTMGNQEVGRCIEQRVATWRFPAPKGGNPVQVTYPFIFKVTN